MNSLILTLNHFASGWLSNVSIMTVQTAVLFLLVYLVSRIFRKSPAVFLYYLWGIMLLRFVFFGTLQVPEALRTLFEKSPAMNVFQLASIAIEPKLSIANPRLSIAAILLLVWAGGILLLTLKLYISEKRFYRSLGQCREIDLDGKFKPLLAIAGVNQKVRVLIGANVPVPFVRGIIKPAVYLPSTVIDWCEDRFRNALMHEIAHIKRRDIIAIALQNILNVLYFFNPVIWLTTLQLNLQREKACDDFALVNLDEDVGKYGKSLLFSLEDGLRQRRYPVMANGLLFPKNIIIKRFDYLYQKGRKIMLTLKPFQKIVVIFVGILAVVLACDSESQQPVESTKPDMMVQSVPKPVFVPYDSPPEPIGGFKAIQENVVYPEKAKQAGIEGTVIIQARVDEKGDIQESVVLKSTGNGELDEAALDAIDKSKFKPAYYKGKPVGVYISIPVIFKLNNDSAVVK
ncbi:MAG: M56 family metallopeptidase [Candidatus Marinimicrobia bacterium]|jgi:TonB family protein|nr:M56 family metallopeptidase [Candidatus Neomarinimicrobiota bacterium]MCK9484275.1 M56 family metallopeptidase [Candidatus Neomarinimicrobiota bacterium]MDD5541012.1 M56 family metallopeptidase [Candidatus Neomarinimicrobiota bacterium]